MNIAGFRYCGMIDTDIRIKTVNVGGCRTDTDCGGVIIAVVSLLLSSCRVGLVVVRVIKAPLLKAPFLLQKNNPTAGKNKRSCTSCIV